MSNKGGSPVEDKLWSLSLYLQNRIWFGIVNAAIFILTPAISEIDGRDFSRAWYHAQTFSGKIILQMGTEVVCLMQSLVYSSFCHDKRFLRFSTMMIMNSSWCVFVSPFL